jgi:hypothetical protein
VSIAHSCGELFVYLEGPGSHSSSQTPNLSLKRSQEA